MKQITSILLAGLFLFNVLGYYGVYFAMIRRADSRAIHAIEHGYYDKSKTVTLKLPVTLPYPIHNGAEYARGDFEYNGEFYKLVERKYENDTIYVVCYRNEERKMALQTFVRLALQFADQSQVTVPGLKTISFQFKDYSPATTLDLLPVPIALTQLEFSSCSTVTLTQYYPVATQPPDSLA